MCIYIYSVAMYNIILMYMSSYTVYMVNLSFSVAIFTFPQRGIRKGGSGTNITFE